QVKVIFQPLNLTVDNVSNFIHNGVHFLATIGNKQHRNIQAGAIVVVNIRVQHIESIAHALANSILSVHGVDQTDSSTTNGARSSGPVPIVDQPSSAEQTTIVINTSNSTISSITHGSLQSLVHNVAILRGDFLL